MPFNGDSTLHVPPYVEMQQRGFHLLIDPATPNWMATDQRGADILGWLRSSRQVDELINEYALQEGVDLTKAWLHVHSFLGEAQRFGFVGEEPFTCPSYSGRGELLQPALRELWVHLNDACNLTCTHCLVRSSPVGDRGLSTEQIKQVVDQALDLGAERVCFTGGEPLLRPDLPELAQYVTERRGKGTPMDPSVVILTNGTLLHGEGWDRLRALGSEKLSLQISLDGSCPEVNDPIRGEGSFDRIVRGIESALVAGFSPTISTAVSKANLEDLPTLVEMLADLGVTHTHLLWMHRRGRALAGHNGFFPTIGRVIPALRQLRRRAEELGVEVDNFTSWQARLDAPRGTRFDLGSAGVETLCLYRDGCVYPSAALAGVEELCCGDATQDSLEHIWQDSDVLRQIRWATVLHKGECTDCEARLLCGGGDVEHSYLHSKALSDNGTHILGPDPYCSLHRALIEDTLFGLAQAGHGTINRRSGFDGPLVYRAMGSEGGECQSDGPSVRTVPSLCVLSSHHDQSRDLVRDFYAHAAREPQEELCCPTGYASQEVDHIPHQVLDRSYGCSSPVITAQVQPGEVVVDLGSGAGIDCFIAARKVGPKGRVIGVDMTPEMLRVARESGPLVAQNLGYHVVAFREGLLEEIPVEETSVDLVVSNCVINLSPDKGRVFREIWRILKPEGRFVISDVVAERAVPSHLRTNPRLRRECIGGALVEEELYANLERAGFSGLQTLRRTFWREVEGVRFLSVTVRGYKFEKSGGCLYRGQQAIYHGPFKAVMDEEGHLFPRGEGVEVCTDTAQKLSSAPYTESFTVMEPDGEVEPYVCCAEACC